MTTLLVGAWTSSTLALSCPVFPALTCKNWGQNLLSFEFGFVITDREENGHEICREECLIQSIVVSAAQ